MSKLPCLIDTLEELEKIRVILNSTVKGKRQIVTDRVEDLIVKIDKELRSGD